jgi:nicotinamidase-related amidase
MDRRSFLLALPAGLATVRSGGSGVEGEIPNRPRVPGTLELHGRRRQAGRLSESVLRWDTAQTAIIICDMWNTHTCASAAQRVATMAPRMNGAVSSARGMGVMIIHAPSDTMKFYEGTPQRLRMQRARTAASPFPIATRCGRDAEEERDFPIDDSAGGCDDPVVKTETGPPWPWTRENAAIDVAGFDGVSDNGQEIYNFCRQEGITNIALMGVHANICILNRSFGARQMTRLGFRVVVVRDLVDAMYDPRTRPFVSHTRGTELVIEHIETKWCPTILSSDLTRVIPGSDNPRSVSQTSQRRG